MSALLTTTMPCMKVVIDAVVEKGVRNDYVVLVHGAPLNEQFANAIGADTCCRDAAVAVETAKTFMAKRQDSTFAKKAWFPRGDAGAPSRPPKPVPQRDRTYARRNVGSHARCA